MKRILVFCLATVLAGATESRAVVTNTALKVLGGAIADVVQEAMPSVVVVRTEAVKYYLGRDMYYGRVYRIPERLVGQGSGAVISKDGYVLTNNHVVDEAGQIEVVFNDGTKYSAKVVGADAHTDLAVLKIDAPAGKTFKPLVAGDSDKLRVGEFVIAVGSPFSLSSSVTLGIVSAKGRSLGLLPYEDFIQTDASINMGNSGGPLLDADGRMVGVNSVIQTAGDSSGNIGISFAVPVNLAMSVAQSLMKSGSWKRPWIGVSMDVTDKGVIVDTLSEDGPAATAGLREGDVIVAVDGMTVAEPHDVQRAILRHAAGDKIAVKILRGGKERLVPVATESMPAPSFRYRR